MFRATAIRRQALNHLVPPKIATPKAVSSSETGARMEQVIDFYSKLPKGSAPNKAGGIKARYFEGENATGKPIVYTVFALFLLGYTIDYQMHLKHHKNNHH